MITSASETPFFLANGSDRLFAVWHEPQGVRNQGTFVFCHPLAEEKLWSHRVFVGFARQLAAHGFGVLRFDQRGNGDSDGDFSVMSVESALSDIRCAADDAKRRSGNDRVHLLGLRFGATLAGVAADRFDDVERLVMWAPITNGGRYLQELLRINIATQTAVYREVRHDRQELVAMLRQGKTVNVDGYALSLPLFEEASAIDLTGATRRHAGPALIVQLGREGARPETPLVELTARYLRGTMVTVREEPFWKEIQVSYLRTAPNLFAATLDWLAPAV